ncbi:hypothetical protein FNF28_01636 [Cafeteria roenbergensis]|uniref:Response regulatory domain-containing protein n=1 Tax=Cafeteria roenbergensis TaxID=33653 RepID=A0A5A8DXG6_CAFRO|nr:hypothetical protein FNF28_01636 [Cafeteria roenbergensis]
MALSDLLISELGAHSLSPGAQSVSALVSNSTLLGEAVAFGSAYLMGRTVALVFLLPIVVSAAYLMSFVQKARGWWEQAHRESRDAFLRWTMHTLRGPAAIINASLDDASEILTSDVLLAECQAVRREASSGFGSGGLASSPVSTGRTVSSTSAGHLEGRGKDDAAFSEDMQIRAMTSLRAGRRTEKLLQAIESLGQALHDSPASFSTVSRFEGLHGALTSMRRASIGRLQTLAVLDRLLEVSRVTGGSYTVEPKWADLVSVLHRVIVRLFDLAKEKNVGLQATKSCLRLAARCVGDQWRPEALGLYTPFNQLATGTATVEPFALGLDLALVSARATAHCTGGGDAGGLALEELARSTHELLTTGDVAAHPWLARHGGDQLLLDLAESGEAALGAFEAIKSCGASGVEAAMRKTSSHPSLSGSLASPANSKEQADPSGSARGAPKRWRHLATLAPSDGSNADSGSCEPADGPKPPRWEARDYWDLVILDISMPGCGGPATAERLRKAGFTGVILGHTGNSVPEDLQYMCDMGADACELKPMDQAKLEHYLCEAFLRRRAQFASLEE